MELVSHLIAAKSRSNNETTLIMPVGDIQWAGADHEVALGMLQRHIKWGVERGAWFLGMGDYIDYSSPSNRARLQGADLYDTTIEVHERTAKRLAEEIFEVALKPSKGRWLGLLEGHHYTQLREGVTTDQLLCGMLNAPFLGTSAYVRLGFQRSPGSRGKSRPGRADGTVLIWAHHGNGGGKRAGAVLNRLDMLPASFKGDIFLMGHHPSKANTSVDYIEPVFPTKAGAPMLVHRTKILAGTGGFLKSYIAGSRYGKIPRGNYAERGVMTPASLGSVLVKVTPRWQMIGGREVWMPDLSVEA